MNSHPAHTLSPDRPARQRATRLFAIVLIAVFALVCVPAWVEAQSKTSAQPPAPAATPAPPAPVVGEDLVAIEWISEPDAESAAADPRGAKALEGNDPAPKATPGARPPRPGATPSGGVRPDLPPMIIDPGPPGYTGPIAKEPNLDFDGINRDTPACDLDDPTGGVATDALDIEVSTNRREYSPGASVTIYFRANRQARVWIFSEDPRGRVRQLLPNAFTRRQVIEANELYRLPGRGYALRVGLPTGTRRIHVLALDANIPVPALGLWPPSTQDPYPLVRNFSQVRRLLRDAAGRYGPPAATFRGRPIADPEWSSRRYFAEAQTTIRVSGRPIGSAPGNPKDDPIDDANPTAGTLEVRTSPPGAELYVNGDYFGLTPAKVTLRAGTYDVTLARRGFETELRRLTITRSRTTRLQLRLQPEPR